MNNQVQSLKENKPIPKWLIGIGLMSLVGLLLLLEKIPLVHNQAFNHYFPRIFLFSPRYGLRSYPPITCGRTTRRCVNFRHPMNT